MATKKFRFSIDRGGTFTDIYAEVSWILNIISPYNVHLIIYLLKVPNEKGYVVHKLLSVDPTHYNDAPREGIRRILEKVGIDFLSSSICNNYLYAVNNSQSICNLI